MMDNKKYKILILSASVGSGHVRAAEAVKKSLENISPNSTIKHIDVLTITNKIFRYLYADLYFIMIKYCPHWVGKIYDKLDKSKSGRIVKLVRTFIYRKNFKKLIETLNQEWDLVINTHFLSAELIEDLQKSEPKLKNISQVTVITDFDVHKLWLTDLSQGYFVATQEAKDYLTALNIPANQVHDTGIPIDQEFSIDYDKNLLLTKYGFTANLPILLLISSRIEEKLIVKLYQSLQNIKTPIQICTITSKDKKIRKKINSIKQNHTTILIEYTNQIHELMTIADIAITKPGGLTSSELLAEGCPILIINPIPGQEEKNSQFLLQNGCAIRPFHIETFGSEMEKLLLDTERLNNMKASAKKQGKKHSAEAVAVKCLELLIKTNK